MKINKARRVDTLEFLKILPHDMGNETKLDRKKD